MTLNPAAEARGKPKKGHESIQNFCSSPSSVLVLTAIGHVELDPKVPGGAPGVVAGCEDDPTEGLDLPDDAGDGRRGQEAVVADDQTSDLHGTSREKKDV